MLKKRIYQNTRPRDYYDVFILSKLKTDNVEMQDLKDAFFATTKKRGSIDVVNNYKAIMEVVRKSEVMKRQWNDYRKEFEYASGIEFEDTCDTVISLMNQLSK